MVASEGVSFVAMHLPQGVRVREGGSLTMKKCTSTGGQIAVEEGTNLVMEDCRVFGNRDWAVSCEGDVKATRCTSSIGVIVRGGHASAELVDCVIRKHKFYGVYVNEGKVTLRRGTISDNAMHGVFAGKVRWPRPRRASRRRSQKTTRRATGTRSRGVRSSASRRRRSTPERRAPTSFIKQTASTTVPHLASLAHFSSRLFHAMVKTMPCTPLVMTRVPSPMRDDYLRVRRQA